jgi:hypothetical protein
VKDRELSVTGVDRPFDIENLNRVLSESAGVGIECLSKLYRVRTQDGEKDVSVVLVPRRGLIRPASLIRQLGEYTPGTTWVRDRAEVLEAGPKHLAMLYAGRRFLPADQANFDAVPIHRSLPPSPATMKSFIGRAKLMQKLWEWFVFGDHPRLYLHGPGGSGKSTLAFEFARLLAQSGEQVRLPGEERLDYVIFISGKETELNPLTAQQQVFTLRNFQNAKEQYTQILYHAGLTTEQEIETADENRLKLLLDDLFSNFSGLIVLDDIDALSRKGTDTGEEMLFMKAALAKKRTRILYTLRYPPPYALSSALEVPGLDENTELVPFVETCATQFAVPEPIAEDMEPLRDATSSLPLLIETVLGLRKFSGNYQEALLGFKEKGGEEARRYLYQREYDRLSKEGKSRLVLAGLLLLEEPVSFMTLTGLFQFTREHVRDALTECTSVFLSISESNDTGETLYQLAPPCVPFIHLVSEKLTHFEILKKSVDHFRKIGPKISPKEAATIVSMERHIKTGNFGEIVAIGKSFSREDPVLVNPKVRAWLGQAYAELGPDCREQAREWFRAAEGLSYRDVFMMRRWFNMEFRSGYGLAEAERICRVMLDDPKLGHRHKSEFLSKRAKCFDSQGGSVLNVSRDKGLALLRQAIDTYFEALWIGIDARNFDLYETLSFLERPIERFVREIGEDVDQIYLLFEMLVQRKHDVHTDGIHLMFEYLLRAPIPVRKKDVRNRLLGVCTRTTKKINQSIRNLGDNPGFKTAVEKLEEIRVGLEKLDQPKRKLAN